MATGKQEGQKGQKMSEAAQHSQGPQHAWHPPQPPTVKCGVQSCTQGSLHISFPHTPLSFD